MDRLRIGRSIRVLRIRRGLRQLDLAAAAGISRAKVARAEAGAILRLRTGDVLAMVEALGADLDVRVRWRGEGLDRLLDAAHAALVEITIELLRTAGWETAVEVSFNVAGERGSVDVLAWHAATATVLIVEVKSVVPDAQSLLSSHDRKLRLGRQIAEARGWQARHIARLLVVGESAIARRRIRLLRSVFAVAYPQRARELRSWLRNPVSPGGSRPFSALVFLPYVHGVSTIPSPAPRQRVRKRGRQRNVHPLGSETSTSG